MRQCAFAVSTQLFFAFVPFTRRRKAQIFQIFRLHADAPCLFQLHGGVQRYLVVNLLARQYQHEKYA